MRSKVLGFIPPLKTLQSKLLVYALSIVMLMGFLSIYAMNITRRYEYQFDVMFQRNALLKTLSDTLDESDAALVNYLSTKSSTSLNRYGNLSERLTSLRQDLMSQNINYTEQELMLLDISNMIAAYSLQGELAIAQKRRNREVAYTAYYQEAAKIKAYMDDYITELNLRQFANNTTQYLTLTRTIRRLNQINFLIIMNLIALSIVIVLRMIQKMVKPIRKLAAAADALSEGNYEIADIYVQSEDEIHVLAQTFNEMKHNIKRYIYEVENKAVTEKKLLDQQMENLKMHHLLDNAKLYALQSQINPHFLYNTMNAALQMANIEEAERTSDILETIANLFRYMVRELKSEVTLGDELRHIEDFKKLLHIRFGDRITLEMAIEPKTLTTIMPPLILQPLVENAYLHGLGKMEEGGLIRITSYIKDHVTWITVEDNGEGMTDERVKEILDGTQTSRGIAMKNVMERLFLFYGHENSVELTSAKGLGTKVSLRLGQARRAEHV